jgi:prepilin-type processing-associated H-X9-DG protein
MATQCKFNEQQLGVALFNTKTEYRFFPLWDDGAAPIRYTWIDVLTQLRLIGAADPAVAAASGGRAGIGYCPADAMPDPLNSARNSNLIYPPNRGFVGVDYSYGINLPLSAGGWRWAGPGDTPRYFKNHEVDTAGRVLLADATATALYNLSGEATASRIWNDPTQYDNTVAWDRHSSANVNAPRWANALFQDGHVGRLTYDLNSPERVNTGRTFIWRPGESAFVNPNDRIAGEWYPSEPAPNYGSDPRGDVIPNELTPAWYTTQKRWTLIPHK